MAFFNPATMLAKIKQLVNLHRLNRHLKHIAITFTIALASTQATVANAFSGDYWGTNGDFSIVTYNVNGLPYFLKNPCTLIPGYQLLGLLPLSPGCLRPDEQDPAVTTPEIGRRLGRWDVVNVQEDFAYHAYLYSTTNQFGYRTATTGIPPSGSGLNTLSYMTVGGLERIRWRNCKNEDCISGKGFTFQRLKVGKGSYIDMYNLHAQAGDDGDSLWVRRDNFVQLSEYIRFKSAGNAVVIAGDTNIRWGREGEPRFFLEGDLGLTDAWVQTQRGGAIPRVGDIQVCAKGSETNGCEVVDRIFYRSGDDIQLWITGYSNEDRNFIYNGKPLSDHRPVAAWFHWQEKAPKISLAAEHSGKCLDVANASLVPGTQLVQWDCKQGDNDNQQFRRIGNTLKIAHSGQCVDVEKAQTTWYAKVTQWPCNGQANQQNDFVNGQIAFKHSGLCASVDRASQDNWAPILQWPCQSTGNEKFEWRWWQ